MEKAESATEIINRILGMLPPRDLDTNMKAVEHLVEDKDDINPISFDFEEIQDSFKKTFLATPYTAHEENQDIYR